MVIEMKRKISLIFNVLIVLFEIIGLILTIGVNKRISFEYYTEDSNILALIISLLFVIFSLNNCKLPKWLKVLKYSSTVCLSVTFFVVLFILTPMYNFNFKYMFFYNSLVFQHLLCPLLSIVTFVFFDDIGEISFKDVFLGLITTLIYSFILIILNIFDVVVGPYPFLMIKKQSIYASIIWFIVLTVLPYIIAVILRMSYQKFHK